MKIKPRDYSRRELIKFFGGSALFLHPLLSSREGYGQSQTKKRLLLMHSANGVIQNAFWPTGTPGSYSFDNRSLAPLKSYMKDINVIKNVKNDRILNVDAHAGGIISLFTGSAMNKAALTETQRYYLGENISQGPSIDQLYASTLKGLPMRSLDVTVVPKNDRWTKYFTFDKNGKKIRREGDPYSVYESLFSESTNCGNALFPATAEMNLKRRSIIDSILADLKTASSHTGLTGEEKIKLEEYTNSIREIELRLAKEVVSDPAVCESLSGFKKAKVEVTTFNYTTIANLLQDLCLAAFQLDITRVATIGYDVAGIATWRSRQVTYNGKPVDGSHHELSHRNGTDWEGKCKAIDVYHATQFARLVGKLKSTRDGNSNLFDNSLAIWSTEVADGQDHLFTNTPFIMAGKAGGSVKTGRFIVAPDGTTHHGLLLDVLDAFGVKHNNQIGLGPDKPRRVLG